MLARVGAPPRTLAKAIFSLSSSSFHRVAVPSTTKSTTGGITRVGTRARGGGGAGSGTTTTRGMVNDDDTTLPVVVEGVVDVRFTQQREQESTSIGLTLEVPLPKPIGTKLLQRGCDEPLGKALGRLKATIVKAQKSGNKGGGKGSGGGGNQKKQKQQQKQQQDQQQEQERDPGSLAPAAAPAPAGPPAAPPPPPPLTVGLVEADTGEGVDEEMETNAEAWRAGRVLIIAGVGRYRVRVNAPSVASVAAVGHPMVGYPLVGCASGTQFCDDDDLRWRWYRAPGGDGGDDAKDGGPRNVVLSDDDDDHHGVVVGEERAYTPTSDDVGYVLTVEATAEPPRGDDAPCCPPATSRLARAVAPAPPRPAARARAAALVSSSTPTPSSSTSSPAHRRLRVMTYNVLADAYSHTWGALYPYLSTEAADPERRLPLAMEDIRLTSPDVTRPWDVVALQEVDRKWYDAFWVPQMRAAGYAAVGALTEKTGLTREGCALFCRADRWRTARVEAIGLKGAGPMPGEETTAVWVETQPHLGEALSKISTVAQLAVLEPIGVGAEERAGAVAGAEAPALVVANTHLFFHPGAVHLRCLQARWLLRHADGLRRRYREEQSSSSSTSSTRDRGVGLVVCGDFNGEPFDGVIRFVKEGRLSAGDGDWALGSVFRWGGTSSRAAAAELLTLTPEDEKEERAHASASASSSPASTAVAELDARQQRLGRMAASWRIAAEVERGARPACGVQPQPQSEGGSEADPAAARAHLSVAQAHARKGCTFKTCAVVAAYTLRRDAGMSPGTTLPGLSRVRYPGMDAAGSSGDGDDEGKGVAGAGSGAGSGAGRNGNGNGNGPEWSRGDDGAADAEAEAEAEVELTETEAADAAEVAEAVRSEVAAHCAGLQALRDEADAAEGDLALGRDDDGGWTARAVGPCAMHLRHPLALESACGFPEWTNYVSGFTGALDYIWADSGAGLRPSGFMPMPPLEAVTAEVALPSSEFPSDHLPMVADLEFVHDDEVVSTSS